MHHAPKDLHFLGITSNTMSSCTFLPYSDLDQASMALALDLQHEEIQRTLNSDGGDVPADFETAMAIFKASLDSWARTEQDRAMARSICRAIVLDGDAIKESRDIEEQASSDRRRALSEDADVDNEGVPQPEDGLGERLNEEPLDDDMLNKLTALYVHGMGPSEEAESSSQAAARDENATRLSNHVRDCAACNADVPFFDSVRCPCGHEYCRACIAELFDASLSDESLFPPRCCGDSIPLGLNQIFLPSTLVRKYHAKELEYGTTNRTYCHEPTCSTFIPPSSIQGNVALCSRCGSQTCTMCKGQSHQEDCPEDITTQELLLYAKDMGWQRCLKCRTLVELNTGCNHISTYRTGRKCMF